ncbi:hypothetical protein [Luteimicrobium sp. DT211]|uniref:hypothetical protein n=1 Tax=Luteimicrobium sp. DT211 TaxID=3393412 RepID=UPI003CF206A4
MPDDAWRHDLRALLEERGAGLRASAARLWPDAADAADALARALTRVFTGYRPDRAMDDAVRDAQAVVVVDDEALLDDLERAVTEELKRGAPDPGAGSGSAPGPDPEAAVPTTLLSAVETRVAAARHARAGRHRVTMAAAAVVGLALAAGVAWGAGYGPGHGSPTSAATAQGAGFAAPPAYPRGSSVECGTRLDVRDAPTGAVTLRLRDTTRRIVATGRWAGTVTVDADDVVTEHVALVGSPRIVVVGPRHEPLAAVGVGGVLWFDVASGRSSVRAVVVFTGCLGSRPLGPGTYEVVAVQGYQDRADWPYGPVFTAVSAPVTVTVTGRGAAATDPADLEVAGAEMGDSGGA